MLTLFVRTSGFSDLVQTFFWKSSILHRSNGIDFNTYFAYFDGFVSSIVSDHILPDFWCICFVCFALFCLITASQMAWEKVLTWKGNIIHMSGGSQRSLLACALLKQETTARSQKNLRTCYLNWLQLQMFQQTVRRKWKGTMLRAHCPWSWHALGQRLKNFDKLYEITRSFHLNCFRPDVLYPKLFQTSNNTKHDNRCISKTKTKWPSEPSLFASQIANLCACVIKVRKTIRMNASLISR